MNRLISIAILLSLTACTYSISNVISSGSSDVVDDEQTASPDVKADVSIPVKAI